MATTDAEPRALRALLWSSETLLAAEVDDAGTIRDASPALERWTGRDTVDEPFAGLVAAPQRPVLERAVRDDVAPGWTTLTLGLLDGGAGSAEDHRVHVSRLGPGAVLVVAEPARAERDALVEQVLALNDDLIATQRALHRRQRELERAQAETKAAADRVRQLEEIVLAGLSAPDLHGVFSALLDLAARVVGADQASILLRAEEGGPLTTVAGPPADEPASDLAEGIAITGEPGVLGSTHLSLAGVPLVSEGEVAGVLLVGAAEAGRFGADDLSLLVRVGDRAALAIGHARLRDRERRIAETLQHSLLPEQLPDLAGLELCARYLPRAHAVHVGGDFYDVVALPDGRAVLAIGDVAGKGLRAASVMGQVRSALSAYALVRPDPASILQRLDRFVSRMDAMVTALCVTIEPDRATARVATAGHLAPLLLRGDGAAALAVPTSPPLGLEVDDRTELVVELAPGDRLVLCTDGLVERRSEPLTERLALLRDVLAAGPPSLPGLCDDVLARMSEPAVGEFDDDVALLTARVSG